MNAKKSARNNFVHFNDIFSLFCIFFLSRSSILHFHVSQYFNALTIQWQRFRLLIIPLIPYPHLIYSLINSIPVFFSLIVKCIVRVYAVEYGTNNVRYSTNEVILVSSHAKTPEKGAKHYNTRAKYGKK